jgi:hypothetical protein
MTVSPQLAAHLAARGNYNFRWLWWCAAKDAGGAAAPIGLWSGADHQDFVIDGVTRTYLVGHDTFVVEDIRREAGTRPGTHRTTISTNRETVQTLLFGRTFAYQPADLYRAFFDPLSGVLIGFVREFAGFVDTAPSQVPSDGIPTVQLSIKSRLALMNKQLPLSKSEASQRLRAPGDGFRKYGSVAGVTTTETAT